MNTNELCRLLRHFRFISWYSLRLLQCSCSKMELLNMFVFLNTCLFCAFSFALCSLDQSFGGKCIFCFFVCIRLHMWSEYVNICYLAINSYGDGVQRRRFLYLLPLYYTFLNLYYKQKICTEATTTVAMCLPLTLMALV